MLNNCIHSLIIIYIVFFYTDNYYLMCTYMNAHVALTAGRLINVIESNIVVMYIMMYWLFSFWTLWLLVYIMMTAVIVFWLFHHCAGLLHCSRAWCSVCSQRGVQDHRCYQASRPWYVYSQRFNVLLFLCKMGVWERIIQTQLSTHL